MKTYSSNNPYNNECIEQFDQISDEAVSKAIEDSHDVFLQWRETHLDERAEKMIKAAAILRENKDKYALDITKEMGKPISDSISEVEKCAWVCEYYAENAASFLKPKLIETDADSSYVSYEPIGPVLAVMPWNYPLWQVFRFAAPALMAGNTALLKHASNVFRCALNIEEVFKLSGFHEHIFQSLIIGHSQVEDVLRNPLVKAATLTGSEKAGKSVAAIAGDEIKKTVLELGGSNAFIVLADADIPRAVETAISARFQNSGQSCIAAKRFIVEAEVYQQFLELFLEKVTEMSTGDPQEKSTKIGPMARQDLAEELNELVQKSVKKGAETVFGGKYKGAFHEPTVLVDVTPDMPIMQEETFGPVAPIMRVNDREEAIKTALNTRFGLGVSICTKDIEFVKNNLYRFPDGAVFVNSLVKSDPRLPFGGTGISGYGRELSEDGMMEFLNKKTVYILN